MLGVKMFASKCTKEGVEWESGMMGTRGEDDVLHRDHGLLKALASQPEPSPEGCRSSLQHSVLPDRVDLVDDGFLRWVWKLSDRRATSAAHL